MPDNHIKSVLQEQRKFTPSAEFRTQARLQTFEEYERLYRQSLDEPEAFWRGVTDELHWFKKWDRLMEWKEPHSKWFLGGETNLSYNCLDRHIQAGRGDRTALIFEGEKGDGRKLTYRELHRETCRIASVLKASGIGKGDCVAIYMPMVPESVAALLACARIGAIHTVVFGGFSAQALAERINDAGAKAVITADGGYRRGEIVHLKEAVDQALQSCPGVKSVLVVRRTGQAIQMKPGRDLWMDEEIEKLGPAADSVEAVPLESEHPLFILYTSGSTGKPKGVLHTTGGYMAGTYLTTQYVFDLRDDDVYWCTADIGWVTGHSYVVYGPLTNGAQVLIYEGAPNYPEPDRFWQIIDQYQVTVFYTAPTAIRAFMKWGEQWPKKHDLSSLRLLGTVGEPINPEAWVWYHQVIGGGRCPIVDTWWQTETGATMITTLPGVHDAKPGSAGVPFFGVDVAVTDSSGKEVPRGEGGYLVIRRPWPSMLRTIYGNDERYRKGYWSEVPHCYFAGDGARRDEDGYFWIMGRIDDVVNVSGHRLGTAEIESALVSHEGVAEAAVVARPHDLKGEAIVAFVSLEGGRKGSPELSAELTKHVVKEIGALARPEEIRFAEALPKTRSGKIMRRLLRSIAAGEETKGDTSTLEDHSILEKLRAEEE